MIKLNSFSVRTNFCTDFSQVFEKTTLVTLVLDIEKEFIYTGFEKGLFTAMVLIYKKRLIPYWPPNFITENEIFRLF